MLYITAVLSIRSRPTILAGITKDRSLDMRWGRMLSDYNPDKAEVLASAGVVHKIDGVVRQ